MNTKFSYMYRDAGNYKTFHAFVFEGEISPEQINRFVDLCDDEMFIPRALGLSGGVLKGEDGYDDLLDHYWCEHDFEDSFELVNDEPDVFTDDGKKGIVKISDFLAAFESCCENWEVAFSKPLNLLDFKSAEQDLSLNEIIERATIDNKIEKDLVNVSLSRDELNLIVKALDVVGDRLADKKGYSAGEKYWDLKEKLENVAGRSKDMERSDAKEPEREER